MLILGQSTYLLGPISKMWGRSPSTKCATSEPPYSYCASPTKSTIVGERTNEI